MLAQDIQYYQELFQRLVAQQKLLGLDTKGGLQGQLALSTSQLLRATEVTQNGDAYRLLTQAQLAEKNFSLTRDLYYAEQYQGHIEELQRLMTESQNIDLLVGYETLFERLKDATVIMGLTHNQGLRGQFRDQAHKAESRLTALDAQLQPILAQQEEKVKQYSIMIAVITSVALVLLLVKSFATFHRAFANFVMFFYRCKRQYQRIDPRQLGFSEFRSLAELANEMVDSRKEMEQRLSEVESKLKSQQG